MRVPSIVHDSLLMQRLFRYDYIDPSVALLMPIAHQESCLVFLVLPANVQIDERLILVEYVLFRLITIIPSQYILMRKS